MGTPFIVIAAPRTGSTLLRMTLNSIEGLVCHGEVLDVRRVRGYEDGCRQFDASNDERQSRHVRLLAERAKDPLAFVQGALNSGAAASGFKALFDVFSREEWSEVIAWLAGERAVRVIHLSRRNELKRYVSEQVLRAGGPIHSGPGGRSKKHVRVRIDPEAFLARTAELRAQRARSMDLFEGHAMIHVWYEDLAEDFGETVRCVAAFLGVEVDPNSVVPPLRKVGSDTLDDVVENLEELLRDPAMLGFLRD